MVSFHKQKLYIRCGILQGPTLGPLFFLIYINDLNNALDKCRVHHSADDTNLLFGSKYPSEISCVMSNELKLLTDWLRANKISLNITVLNIKACVYYFLSKFYFSLNYGPSKTIKNVFYFI